MGKRKSRSGERYIWILVMTILLIFLFLAFYRYMELSGSWMKSIEDTQKLQESYTEILQQNQEKIKELEEQLQKKAKEE